jgi:3-oxoacyl-[acyl-carrier-protein] synthase-3
VREYAEKTGRPADSYDAVVLHQANMMVLKNIAKRLGVEFEKCPVSIDRYGNTSSASVPLTISDKYGEDKDGKELSLLTSGFGIGLSWGVLDFTINTDDIYPVLATDITFDDGFTDQ